MRAIFMGLLAVLLVTPDLYAPAANANSTARTLRFYNIHTKEYLTVTYKVNDRFVPAAMNKLNAFMGDWRVKDQTKMDPELIDLIWRIYTQLGATEPIHLISGYRSQKTNSKLRAAGGGQAKYSQHILGKAADIHIPGVPVKKLRNLALIQEFGGVGYYPNSGVPFVHVDTGRVRMWPRIPHMELAALFPDGKTDYIPSDGRRITQADYRSAASSGKYQTAADILRGRPSAPATVAVASVEPPPLPTPAPFRELSNQLASAGNTQPNNPLLAATNVNYRPMSLGQADETAKPEQPASAMASAPLPNRKPASPFAMASLGGTPSFSSNLVPTPTPRPAPAPKPIASSNDSSTYRKTEVMSANLQDEEHPDETLIYAQYNVAMLMSDRPVGYDPDIAPLVHPRQSDLDFVFEEMTIPTPLQLRETGRVMSLALSDHFDGAAVRSLYAALPGNSETRLASR
ncbi:DUF882 domain-containing protein [Methyloligella halotolerans]|uniref:DUF882 domain-containing protein n=1 Tax=Methyloligella halotolerans TaxID=1177755 RepID=UPI00083D65FC|nr:DUF882 domain-containing protein [Methyloligella halotolerans]